MKRISYYVLFILLTHNVYGACQLTNHMLSSGSDADYDEYLYADTSQYELRREGKPGLAYLCGTIQEKTYCPAGTKIRLQNASVGGGTISNDAVYECINTGNNKRTSYRWVKHEIQETCIVNSVMFSVPVSDVDNANGLLRVNDSYCKDITQTTKVSINNQTNGWDTFNTLISEHGESFRSVTSNVTDVAISSIENGTEIVVNFSDNVTERFKIFKNGTVSIVDTMGKTVVGTITSLADGTVRIFDSTGKTFVGALTIAKDGTVKIFDTTGRVVETLSDNVTKGYITTLDFFQTGITETNKTIRALSGDVRDVAVTGIGGGVEITTTLINGGVETFRITKDGLVSAYNSSTKMVSATIESVTDGAVQISANMIDGTVRIFELTKDGIVKVVQTGGDIVKKLSGDTVQSLKTLCGSLNTTIRTAGGVVESVVVNGASVLKTGIIEAGKTVRALSGDVRDVAVTGINDGTEIIVNFSDNLTERLRIFKDGTVSIVDTMGKTVVGTITSLADGTVRIFDSTGKTFVGALKILSDGTVHVLGVTGNIITTISKNMTDAYMTTLQFFGARLDSFDESVRTTIKSSADVVKTTIQTAGNIVTTAMDNATDFAKHFSTEIINGVQALQINKHRLGNIEKRLAECTTQEQVAQIINQALQEAELNATQCEQVQRMIGKYDAKLTVITNSVAVLAKELAEHKKLIMQTAQQIRQLGGQYTTLAAQVETKVNAKQVVELIGQYTQEFSDGQVTQLYAILEEYTRQLTDGQRTQVEGLISAYVDPKIRIEKQQRIATDKIISAMSVLNSFTASADVSVWKNDQGKFNTARLASDATAGIVLGTIGGLISNNIVKKNQVKSGFENINCSVGGQIIADWGDEFMVGIQ